jgi:hypothetical protein
MVQRVLALVVALLLCPIAVAPALAHHRPDQSEDSTGWWDEQDDESLDDESEESLDETYDDGGVAPTPAYVPMPVQPQPSVPPGLDDLDPMFEPGLPGLPDVVVPKGKTIAGTVALVRADGKAAIPRGAPKRVRQLIAAANQIVGKPYKWGGGHRLLVDRGYDCSGTVSYALIRTGLLRSPLVSGALARWGSGGAGRWISVFANRGHVYLEVAGLRLDTSSVGDRGGRSGVRWRPVIGRRGGFAERHPAGL